MASQPFTAAGRDDNKHAEVTGERLTGKKKSSTRDYCRCSYWPHQKKTPPQAVFFLPSVQVWFSNIDVKTKVYCLVSVLTAESSIKKML